MHTPALKEHYQKHVVPELMKEFGFKNPHQVPAIQKIVLNTAFGTTLDKKDVEKTQHDLSAIAGQHAVVTNARKAISNFKLREGMPIGAKVTLRGRAMYEFMYRLVGIALPGIRDFRGVPTRFDGNGNYTLGIEDHSIFPEISGDGHRSNMGMDITFVTSAETDEQGRKLMELMGMPFRKKTTTQSAA